MFQINTIGEGHLTNLSSLAMLSLSNNNISFIHPSALQNTPNLRYVYLAENSIQSFESGTMAQFKQAQVRFHYIDDIALYSVSKM